MKTKEGKEREEAIKAMAGVVEKLKEYKVYFEKWDGDGVPHVDYDKKIENKYRKKMRKSFDMVSEYFGG